MKKKREDRKIWYAGKVSKEELEEIDNCKLCRIMPELEKTCYATEYCHRQTKMVLEDKKDEEQKRAGQQSDAHNQHDEKTRHDDDRL